MQEVTITTFKTTTKVLLVIRLNEEHLLEWNETKQVAWDRAQEWLEQRGRMSTLYPTEIKTVECFAIL